MPHEASPVAAGRCGLTLGAVNQQTTREPEVDTMRLVALCLAMAVSATRCSATGAAERDLVAHYTLDEGAGAVLHDRSGHGNDGRICGAAEWVRTPNGSALAFNGKDTYVT
jgi:hypothetical protein